MSRTFRTYLADRFNCKTQSDCSIVFYQAPAYGACVPAQSACNSQEITDGPPSPPSTGDANPVKETLGEPIPAHLLVICGGSPRFCAQVERWTQESDPSAKPMLRVPLDSADELPYALSTLRFMYTDSLDVTTMDALLRVRRLAAYLQVDGCMEACDSAIASLASASSPEAGPGVAQGPLAGVLTLYSQRHLLPSPSDDEDAVLKLLDICRQQLVQHSGAVGGVAGPLVQGGPSLGELLAWAFRDAPSLLSDPASRKQVEGLPVAALEALLRCDAFTTDDEASVLLVAATWLKANNWNTDAATRLCKLVRLSQLSSAFLHIVLPCLSWFPITPEEHRFLCHYAAAPVAQRLHLALGMLGKYDISSAWYTATVRQGLTGTADRTWSYDWQVTEGELSAALAKDADAQSVSVNGQFANGGERVVSYGLEWYPCLRYDKGKAAAGAFLCCTWPAALLLQEPAKLMAVVPLRGTGGMEVFRSSSSSSSSSNSGSDAAGASAPPVAAWSKRFAEEDYVRVGWEWGDVDALPLQVQVLTVPAVGGELDGQTPPPQQQQAERLAAAQAGAAGSGLVVVSALAPWVPYMHPGGKLSGRLWWGLQEDANAIASS